MTAFLPPLKITNLLRFSLALVLLSGIVCGQTTGRSISDSDRNSGATAVGIQPCVGLQSEQVGSGKKNSERRPDDSGDGPFWLVESSTHAGAIQSPAFIRTLADGSLIRHAIRYSPQAPRAPPIA